MVIQYIDRLKEVLNEVAAVLHEAADEVEDKIRKGGQLNSSQAEPVAANSTVSISLHFL